MELNIENLIITLSSVYLLVRGGEELYGLAKRKYFSDYLPLKQALRYRANKEVYHYHLFHYAQKLMNENKTRRARKYLQIILTENANYQLANYLMGVICFQNQEYTKAVNYFELEIPFSPDHPMVYFFLSKCYFQLGNHPKSLETLQNSIDLNPYYYPAYLLALEIFTVWKIEPRTEWAFFRRAEELQCLIRPVWLHMAELEKSFLEAKEQADRAKVYASLEEAWLESNKMKFIIIQAISEKRFFQAETLIVEGIRLNPHDNQLYQLYDQVLMMQKKYPAALNFYESQIKRINPNPLEAQLRLTDYLVFNREYKRALELMLEVFKNYSYAKFLHYPLCILYNWLNQPSEAIWHLARAIYFDNTVKKLARNNPELKNLQERDEFKHLV